MSSIFQGFRTWITTQNIKWQSQWFFKQWINFLKLISTLTVQTGICLSLYSTECSAPEEGSSAAAPQGFTPAKKKPKASSFPQCPASGPHKQVDEDWHYGNFMLWKNLKRIFHLQSAFFSASSWTPCVGFSRPTCLHPPAQAFLGGWTTSPTLRRALSL